MQPANMWQDQDIFRAPERIILGQRFLAEHIQDGASLKEVVDRKVGY